MTDYHVKQLDGSKCAGYNCAASSGAMGLFWQTGETLTGAGFRTAAGVSCVPGVHSNSGGLFISDVVRVYQEHGAVIDYGAKDDPPAYTRWAPPEMSRRLQAGFGGVILGDYDALPRVYRASSTFLGDHSAWVHDHRVVLGVEQTHWHDPLRTAGLWIPISAVISYWQKATSPIRGYAGWVTLRDPEGDMDPKVDIPVGRANIASGGSVYGDPGKKTTLIAAWIGAQGVQVYSQRAGLTAFRIDLASGPAEDLRIGWIGNDKVTIVSSVNTDAAKLEGRRLEWDRQSAGAKVGLVPRP